MGRYWLTQSSPYDDSQLVIRKRFHLKQTQRLSKPLCRLGIYICVNLRPLKIKTSTFYIYKVSLVLLLFFTCYCYIAKHSQTNQFRIMKHLFKKKVIGCNLVNNWYQSKGSNPWEKPMMKPSTGFQSGRYLLRETPNRLYQWTTRTKKSLSPKANELLA